MQNYAYSKEMQVWEYWAPMPRDVSSQMWPSLQWHKLVLEGNFVKRYNKFIAFNLFFVHLILFWIDELVHFYSIYMSGLNIEFHLWYENCRLTFSNASSMKVFEFRLQFHPNHPNQCWSSSPTHRYGISGDEITKLGKFFHYGLVHLVKSASLRWNSSKIFHTVFETLPVGAKSLPILTPDYWHPPHSNFTEYFTIESDKTTSIYNVSTRVLGKK